MLPTLPIIAEMLVAVFLKYKYKYGWTISSMDIYRPQRSCGQGNVFTGVCHSLCSQGEGVCLSACWDTTSPPGPGRHPLRSDTPPGPGRHPWDQADPPWDQADTPLEPGRPPWIRHPPYQADTPADQAGNPPGSRLQHTVYEQPVRILLECILV